MSARKPSRKAPRKTAPPSESRRAASRAAAPRATAPEKGGKRRRLAQWLQLGLFNQPEPPPPSPAPVPEIRVPARLRAAIREEQAERLARKLSARMRVPLASLTLTDNRSVLLSTARKGQGLKLRLHRAFVDADREALEAAVAFAVGCSGDAKREALARLRAHVDSWRDENDDDVVPPRMPTHRLRGAWHDLGVIRDTLNRRYFDKTLEPDITWGRWSALRGRRRTIRLGSYDARENLIRVHPALDQSWVPRLFVEAVVYHEMLHALMPAKESGGRRCLHGPEFRRRERQHPAFATAESWLSANVHKLLRSRPRR